MGIRNCALITGASKGFGAALAQVFAEHKYELVLHGRERSRLAQVAKIAREQAVDPVIIAGDLQDNVTIEILSAAAASYDVSVLVNNAAMLCPGLPLQELTDAQIETMIGTNLTAAVKLTYRFYMHFLTQKRGTIININSMAGLEPKRLRSAYCASKWGLRGFTESLRIEAAEQGIRVFGVYPTKMQTAPEDTFGLDPMETARKVFAAMEDPALAPNGALVIDGRP